MRAISQETPQPSVTEVSLKNTYLKFHSNFPGASELIIAYFFMHSSVPAPAPEELKEERVKLFMVL